MANDKIPELTKSGFDDFMKNDFALVDFYADWCMPCIMMAPVMEELSDDFNGKIKFAKVNIEEHPELAEKFEIASIPNFILFKDGEPAQQFIGAMNVEDFRKKLKKFA